MKLVFCLRNPMKEHFQDILCVPTTARKQLSFREAITENLKQRETVKI
jgi:hypothetical protein